ncbi:hypothetical protein ACWGJB_39715 [Streptomyces sp. NPDC054813]
MGHLAYPDVRNQLPLDAHEQAAEAQDRGTRRVLRTRSSAA